MSEDEFGIQLEEWESSDDKQDPPSVSAVEDLLLFESKTTSALVLCGCIIVYLLLKWCLYKLISKLVGLKIEEFCMLIAAVADLVWDFSCPQRSS